MILDCKFQILGIKTTVGHYIIIFSRNSSCLLPGKAIKSIAYVSRPINVDFYFVKCLFLSFPLFSAFIIASKTNVERSIYPIHSELLVSSAISHTSSFFTSHYELSTEQFSFLACG